MKVRRISALFVVIAIVLAVSFGAAAQQKAPRISTEPELKEDLALGPCKNAERLEAVNKLFMRMGAPEAEIKSDKVKDIQNVIFTKKGKTNETVVIGAHYDKVSVGCGIIDNWSGIVILAHLMRTLGEVDTQKTYVFAAFDREEEGMRGSAAMVKEIPKEARANYCSMVNLDSFGLGYPFILENASSPKMIKFAKDLGTELKATVNVAEIPGASSDSASFKDKDIPAITLSALSGEWPRYMHNSNDKIENVIPGSVRVGYRFALEYITRIDAGACSMFAK
jgi:Iap family predicted aminopeptidase